MRSHEERRLKLYRGVWCVVWRERGETKRASLRTADRGQAERNFQEFLKQESRAPETVSEIIDLWLEEKKALRSIENVKFRSKYLKNHFGNLHPEQITRAMCREYRAFRGVSNTSIRNELSILRSALRWQDKNTKAVIELPPPDPPRDNFVTMAECKKLIATATSPHIKLFIILAWGTAARSNALLELTWARVDFERKLINLAGENRGNKRRAFVPMTATVFEALQEAYKGRTSDFVIEYAGAQVGKIVKGFRETAKRAGLKVSPHDIRRSAARHMVENGVDIYEVAQYLGHTNPQITYKIYARYSPDYLRKAADVLDQ